MTDASLDVLVSIVGAEPGVEFEAHGGDAGAGQVYGYSRARVASPRAVPYRTPPFALTIAGSASGRCDRVVTVAGVVMMVLTAPADWQTGSGRGE